MTTEAKSNNRNPEETLPPSLQESVLATLAFDERWGAVIATLVTPHHFDEPLNEIAKKLLAFREKLHKPIGPVHLDDLFDVVTLMKASRSSRLVKALHRIAPMRNYLNGEYVASRVPDLVRRQTQKAASMEAGARYEQGGENLVEDVDAILEEALRNKIKTDVTFGVPLTSELSALKSMFDKRPPDEFTTGIPLLDAEHVVPAREKLTVLLGATSAGKSWFLQHLGKQALMQRKRVLHITLEPISKSSEEDEEAGELHEAKEVLRIKLPADKNATLPLYPGEEAFNQPAPGISPKPSSILRGALAAIGSVRRDHLDAVFA